MASTATGRDMPGYRVAEVEAWIAENVPSLAPPFDWTQLVGGHSNLTYKLVNQKGHKAVIRRPPEGELLPKAHDMSREWALISALSKTDVPVPAPLGFCESPDITGAWFYVMGWVDGVAVHNRADVEARIPQAERGKVAVSLIEALAALHRQDPDEIGLGTLGKKTDYINRQIRAWYGSWTASAEVAKHDDPRAHTIKEFLEQNIPEQGQARVVHGDCALHNVLIGDDFKVSAILDWEVATLGDPRADAAYALNSFPDADDAVALSDEAITSAPGFPTKRELAERYAEMTGTDPSTLGYYYAFNHWKTACILHGVRARYVAGAKSAKGVDLDAMKATIERALTLSDQAMHRLSA